MNINSSSLKNKIRYYIVTIIIIIIIIIIYINYSLFFTVSYIVGLVLILTIIYTEVNKYKAHIINSKCPTKYVFFRL